MLGQPWRALPLYVGVCSGLRVGEMLGLNAKDINLAEGAIHVERQYCGTSGALIPPKYGSRRITVFSARLDDQWTQVLDRRDRLTSRPFPLPVAGMSRIRRFKEPVAAVNYRSRMVCRQQSEVDLPQLRYYFCAWVLAGDGLGLDVADVSRIAGHRNPQITWQVYVQSRPDRVNRAREASRRGGR